MSLIVYATFYFFVTYSLYSMLYYKENIVMIEGSFFMLQKIYEMIDGAYNEMVEIRRYLHQHPEVSFHETETAKYIQTYYDKLQIPYEKNVGGNGVVATLKGGKPGKTIAFRADFDALPIQDEKDVAYKSTVPGVMHACGHDGHTATLLVLAKVCKAFANELSGTIVFVHQHAEELAPGGAKPMIETGILQDVDYIFGNHLWSTTPFGTILTKPGVLMAGADRFEITINGQGGHGAYPHETKDAIVIGSQVIAQLQQIVSRRIDPLKTAVITVGQFNAGNAFNIIADKATIIGTVRYLDTTIQDQLRDEIERVIKGITLTHDASYTFSYVKGYPPVVNHEVEAEMILDIANEVEGVTDVIIGDPQMGAEDFAYYLHDIPGAFFFTGAQLTDTYPHHHPKFDFDERAMKTAAKMFMRIFFEQQNRA